MGRPLRGAFENASYHITSRGMRKENIMDYTAVSQSCRRFEREMSRNKRIRKMLKEIQDVL